MSNQERSEGSHKGNQHAALAEGAGGCSLAGAWGLRTCLCCLLPLSFPLLLLLSLLYPLFPSPLLHLSHVYDHLVPISLPFFSSYVNVLGSPNFLLVLNTRFGCWKPKMTKLASSVKLARMDKDGRVIPGDGDDMRMFSFGREHSVSLINPWPQNQSNAYTGRSISILAVTALQIPETCLDKQNHRDL